MVAFNTLLNIYLTGSPIPVAFSVALEHNITLSMGEHVVYDKILVNVGNAYNQNSGEFTVPVDGLYVVHYHALSEQGQVCTILE